MTRDEALQLTREVRTLKRHADWAYDSAKDCAHDDFSGKDHYYARAKKYWEEKDKLTLLIRCAGFGELLDNENSND